MDCFACTNTARADQPPRERIVQTEHWRVAHAFNTSLPGWLVALPTRHVLSFADLDAAAAAEFGTLLRDLTTALIDTTGCVKTYVAVFAEAEGFAHLHAHVVPRMPDQPAKLRGPGIFAKLGRPEAEWVPESERDRLGLAIRAYLG